jgi:hypothetical protein
LASALPFYAWNPAKMKFSIQEGLAFTKLIFKTFSKVVETLCNFWRSSLVDRAAASGDFFHHSNIFWKTHFQLFQRLQPLDLLVFPRAKHRR